MPDRTARIARPLSETAAIGAFLHGVVHHMFRAFHDEVNHGA